MKIKITKKIQWNGIKNKIVRDSEFGYKKDYIKIKFNSDDNLPLDKPQNFC